MGGGDGDGCDRMASTTMVAARVVRGAGTDGVDAGGVIVADGGGYWMD